MADIKSPEERSRNMARIRSRDTGPEIDFRRMLFARGYRYRKNVSMTGHPDVWLPGRRVAVFVHGCFWHQHSGCSAARIPSTRTGYWEEKFRRNAARDQQVRSQLLAGGVRVLVVWECTVRHMVKSADFREAMLLKVDGFMNGDGTYLEI